MNSFWRDFKDILLYAFKDVQPHWRSEAIYPAL